MSHSWRAGNPSVLIARSAATISASVVECDAHGCFLLIAFHGKNEFAPVSAINTPDVDFAVSRQPAKSASLNRCYFKVFTTITDVSFKLVAEGRVYIANQSM